MINDFIKLIKILLGLIKTLITEEIVKLIVRIPVAV